MGNQQLLLLVLGSIIVAIAIVVGISEFRSNHIEEVGDEMQEVILSELADARMFFGKPVTLGGGGGSFKGWTKHLSTRSVGDVDYMFASDQVFATVTGMAGYGYLVGQLEQQPDGPKLKWYGTKAYANRSKDFAPF